jgi:hypothetical protein
MKKWIGGAVVGSIVGLMFAGTVVTHGFWGALMAWGIAVFIATALAWGVFLLTDE